MFEDTTVRMFDAPELSLSAETDDNLSEEELSENFLPIGDVAKSIGVNASVLRFWEQEFPQLRPKKRGNRRYYSAADVELIRTIQHLLYEEHYTIIGARNRIHEMQVQKKVSERFGEELAKPIVPNAPKHPMMDAEQVLGELKAIRSELRKALGITEDPFLTSEENRQGSPEAGEAQPGAVKAETQTAAEPKQEPAPALKVPPLPGERTGFTAGMNTEEKRESSLIFSSPIFWKR